MVDYGHQETDKLLESVESKVQKVYSQTEKEVQKKLTAYMKQFESEDKAKLKLLKKGKITQEEYTKWRSVKMLSGQHYQAVLDTLAADYANADKIAMSIVGQHLPEAYAINRNFAAFQVEQGARFNTSFALYDTHTVEHLMKRNKNILPKPRVDIPKDKRWNRAKIREQITKGVLSGDSIPHIADRLQRVTDMDRSAAIRNARTAMTGAQNQGRVDSYKYAQSLGIELEKEWRATLDGKTRHAHRALDGERVPVDGVFSVAGSELEFPGDPNCTDPSLVYNCRCTLVAAIKDIDYSKSERYSKLGDMSYEEWKYGKSKIPKKDNWQAIKERAIREAKVFSYSYHEQTNYSKEWWNNLTPEERHGVKRYTGSSYRSMNRTLRNGETPHGEIAEYIRGCESAIASRKIADDTLLYRGMGSNESLARALGVEKKIAREMVEDGSIVGQRFVEKGFCSSGVSKSAGWDKEVSLEIIAPKGTVGFYVDLVSSVPGEREMLLQRGTIFEVIEVVDDDPYETVLKVIVAGTET